MNIDELCQVKVNKNIPDIRPGDSVKVGFKIKEASKERLQTFSGLVIKIRRGNGGGNFTIRKVANGIGVEHTFPFASPLLEKVEVVRRGKVRRAKLYYIRRLSTKEARLKERREKALEEAAVKTGVSTEEVAAPVSETAAPEANKAA